MFTLRYELEGHGWAKVFVGNGEREVEAWASNLAHTEPLSGFLDEALAVAWTGHDTPLPDSKEFVRIDGESVAYVFTVTVTARDYGDDEIEEYLRLYHSRPLSFTVTRKEGMYAGPAESDFRGEESEVLHGDSTVREFALSVHDVVEKVLDSYSLTAFEEGWGVEHEFPLVKFARLRRSLGLAPKTFVLD